MPEANGRPPPSSYDNEANKRMRRSGASSKGCPPPRLNGLWSVWYGLFGTVLAGFAAVRCARRYLRYASLQWATPCAVFELQISLLLTAAAVLLLPLFLVAAVLRVGNLANDGIKLGRCSPPAVASRCSLWRHGGPTAPFLHVIIALLLLIPKLVMEARLLQSGYLSPDSIWRTDLDFLVVHRDRLVVLSFMTASPGINSTVTSTPPPTAAVAQPVTSESLSSTSDLIDLLRRLLDPEPNDSSIDAGWGSSVSVEYLNYAVALLVYSVRYPAVFWAANKCFGLVFSLQLLANAAQNLLGFAGMSVLYKVQVIGAWKALPLLGRYPDGTTPSPGRSPFLLDAHVTLALFVLSTLLILASSLVLYLYGHGRFNSFLNHQHSSKHIFPQTASSGSGWGYFTHCAALCCLLAVAVCNAPLLYDYTIVYRGSLDGAVLACIVGAILHLFLWVVVWLFLTIKHKWNFTLRVTIGKATVRSARNVKLVTDVDLTSSKSDDSTQQPLLIVGNGRTYTVTEHSPKKAIMSVVQKATLDKKAKTTANSVGGSESTEDPDGEEQIYWLRPASVAPQRSPDSEAGRSCWPGGSTRKSKHKVTFDDAATSSTSSARNKSGISKSKIRNGGIDEDDGDYATLRELPLAPQLIGESDDTTSEEGKLLACVRDDNVTYASTSRRDLLPPGDYEDPSPLLTPEPLGDGETERLVRSTDTNRTTGASNAAVTVHNQQSSSATPRCLRRADSGMPHEELTPRSDSISTESSASPPEALGSNHSETSSGVHSNASSDHNNLPLPPPPPPPNPEPNETNMTRRATSVADLVRPIREDQWKSFSLTRNVQPPTEGNPFPNQTFHSHHTKNHSTGGSYGMGSRPGYGYTPQVQSIYITSTNVSQSIYGYTTNAPPKNTTADYRSHSTSSHASNINSHSSNINNTSHHPSNMNHTGNNQGSNINHMGHTGNINHNMNNTLNNGLNSPNINHTPMVAQVVEQVVVSNDPKYGQGIGNESKYGQTIGNESKYGQTIGNEPKYGQTIGNEPKYGQTIGNEPKYGQVVSNDPINGQVVNNDPKYVQVVNNDPKYGQVIGQSMNNDPKYGQVIGQSMSNDPMYGQVVGNDPNYGQSMSNDPKYGQVRMANGSEPRYGYTSGSNRGSISSESGYGYTTGVTQSNGYGTQSLYGYTGQGARVTYSPSTSTVYGQMDGSTSQPQPLYGYHRPAAAPLSSSTYSVKDTAGIPVILENQESTVVIRRKNTPSVVCDSSQSIDEEPFGRSTNMRMTSFTDRVPEELKNIQASSATLPHYPTQSIPPSQQYSTMPLPLQQKTTQPSTVVPNNSFPRQHSTIPTHHNGVRLFPPGQNPYVKRFQPEGYSSTNRESYYSS